jgi:hypothetical protein
MDWTAAARIDVVFMVGIGRIVPAPSQTTDIEKSRVFMKDFFAQIDPSLVMWFMSRDPSSAVVSDGGPELTSSFSSEEDDSVETPPLLYPIAMQNIWLPLVLVV